MRIHGQKGLSLSGFLMWAVLFIIVALIAFKVGPPYMEFLTIQAQLKAIANDPEGATGYAASSKICSTGAPRSRTSVRSSRKTCRSPRMATAP